MNWKFEHRAWFAGPFTIVLEVCERRKLTIFELYDSTRFVKAFASVQEAQQHAEAMQHVAMQRAS